MLSVYGSGDYRASEQAYVVSSRDIPLRPRRAVVMVAGAGRTAAIDNTGVTTPVILSSLGDAGYPVIAADLCGHGTAYWSSGAYTWGNSAAVAAIESARTYMASLPNVKADQVYLFAGSMGAADALNYYKANPSKVAGMALSIPLLDLNDLSSNDKGFIGSNSTSFVGAGMVGLSLPQATITLSENVSASGLAAAGIPGAGGQANACNILTSSGWQVVTFTGASGTSLTGCAGGVGTMSATSLVSQGYGKSLVAAYGGTWPTLLSPAQLAANSPALWSVRPGGLTVPVRVWSSDNDFIASNTAACRAWAEAVAQAGGGNTAPTVVSMGNIGHVSTVLDAKQVGAWFDTIGGRS